MKIELRRSKSKRYHLPRWEEVCIQKDEYRAILVSTGGKILMWPNDEHMTKEDHQALESVFNPKVQCNLCGIEFDKFDPLIEQRKARHQEFHSHCKIQKRNTAEGKVVWRVLN